MENENLSVKNDISLDENLEDSKKYKLNCNKEKELFLNIIITVIFGFVGFSFVYYFQQNEIKNKENLIKAFSENKELICSSKVVSISNAYKFDEKRKNYITNDIDIFYISRCHLK